MAGKKDICIVTNQVDYALIRKLVSSLERDWSYNVIKASSISSYEATAQFNGGIIVFYASSPDDVKDLIKYFEILNTKTTRVIVVSKSNSPKVEKLLTSAGASDYYHISAPVKNIIRSIEEQFSSISEKDRAIIKEIAAMSLRADCWFLEMPDHIKKINGFWCIYLIGPGPNTGIWQRCEEFGKDEYWEFVPKDPMHDTLKGEEGSWLFKGNKPKFENCHWQFVSKKPHLMYFLNGITEVHKFKLESKGLILAVARNSQYVKNKLPKIEESQLALYEYAKKAKSIDDLKGEISSEFTERIHLKLVGKPIKEKKKVEISFDTKSKHFTMIETLKEKKRYLSKLTKNENELTVWTKGQKIVLEALANQIKEGQYSINFKNVDEGKNLIGGLESGDIESAFVRGDLSEVSVFFTLDGPTFDINSIKILVPNLMWKVQRRQYSRLKLDGRKQVKATLKIIGKNRVFTISAPIRNIGAGGIAVLIDESHQSLFTPGKMIKEIKFFLNEELIFTSANIKWKGHLRKKDQLANYNYCLGLEFIYIAQRDIDYIQRYVLEELHKLEEDV